MPTTTTFSVPHFNFFLTIEGVGTKKAHSKELVDYLQSKAICDDTADQLETLIKMADTTNFKTHKLYVTITKNGNFVCQRRANMSNVKGFASLIK